MQSNKIIKTDWYAEQKLIITRLSGDVELLDIEQWEKSLQRALSQIEDNDIFKILVNLWGFKAVNIEAHKRYRVIIPLMLADYGWKVGYVELFEEASTMQYHTLRGIQCVGAAHVHHDATKIEKYEILFDRENERIFTDPQKAEEWILNLPITHFSSDKQNA